MSQKKNLVVGVAIALAFAADFSSDANAQLLRRRLLLNSHSEAPTQGLQRRQIAAGILSRVATGTRPDSHGGNHANTAKVLSGSVGSRQPDFYSSAFPYRHGAVQAAAHEAVPPNHRAIADLDGHKNSQGIHVRRPLGRPAYGGTSSASSFFGEGGHYGAGYPGAFGSFTNGSKPSLRRTNGECSSRFSGFSNGGYRDRGCYDDLLLGSGKSYCKKRTFSNRPIIDRTCEKPSTVCLPLSAIGCLSKFDCDRRMRTSAKLDRQGVLHVDIEMRTEPGAGFQAAAIVGILDHEGNLMWARKTPDFRVSGNPYADNGGLSLERHWDKKIPSRFWPHIEALVIVNSTRSTRLLRALLDNREDRLFVEEILEESGAQVYWREETVVDRDW